MTDLPTATVPIVPIVPILQTPLTPSPETAAKGIQDSLSDTEDPPEPADPWAALNIASQTATMPPKSAQKAQYPVIDQDKKSDISNFTSPARYKVNANGSRRYESKSARVDRKKAEKRAEEEEQANETAKKEAERAELKRRLEELGTDQPGAPAPAKTKPLPTPKAAAKNTKPVSDADADTDNTVSHLHKFPPHVPAGP